MNQLSVRLPKWVEKDLRKFAAKHQISVAYVIREAVQQILCSGWKPSDRISYYRPKKLPPIDGII